VVACACWPSYKGSINRRITVHAVQGTKERPYLKITKEKRAGGMAYVVEHLCSKPETLSSNPIPAKKKILCPEQFECIISLNPHKKKIPRKCVSLPIVS
jgi:hypothetical protein